MTADTHVTDRAAAMLRDRLGDRLQLDVPLGPMTTYRVGGSAAMYVHVEHQTDLSAVAEVRAETGIDFLVIGRGSNMLVSDDGFHGVALSVAGYAGDIELGRDVPLGEARIVSCGGGVSLPVMARRTAAASIAGFEWAVGVPGSIGGAVRMNAGGHGSDMAASLLDVAVVDLDGDPAPRTLPVDAVGLRFRASSLAPSQVVVSARLGLRQGNREESEAEISEIVRWRRDNQPGGQNCGSVFVNPVPGEVTAGGLIDGLGLRGFSIGTAYVSEKHANFVQATDGGRSSDVRAVIEAVRDRVADETGYRLRSEVRLVGFEDADPLSFAEPTADQP